MTRHFPYYIGLICFVFYPSSSYAAPLSLSESERLAIVNSSELRQIQANARTLAQQAIANGQLSDPQLKVGAANVPTDSFRFTQDDMTMIEVGLQQAFPRGHSLAVKSKQIQTLAKAQQKKLQEQAALLLRSVRETWLDLYYWLAAKRVIHKNLLLYQHLLKVTESQYSAGKGNQSDVLQLQIELSRLHDQDAQIQQHIEVLRAQLGRWIGVEQANRPLSRTLPTWPEPLALGFLEKRLQHHPLLKVDAANVEAARGEVAYAKEQFKPGWMVDIGYGIRQGNMADGGSRSDFVGVQVTLDLPVFPENRQNRQLQASTYQLESAQLERDIHYKDLSKELNAQYAIWRSLSRREYLYRDQLIPETKQNSKAALLAYQTATTDLTTVLRAYSNEIMIHLEQLHIQVERTKARAALLYLEGMTA